MIAGELKGRRLKAVPGANTRPTTDKVKESLFNMIGPYFDGGTCFDMYSGSGALAIEAVSRGIDHAFLSEKNRKALQIIRENLFLTKMEENFTVMAGDSTKNLKKIAENHPEVRFRLVFLDPPYQAEKMEADMWMMMNENLVDETTTIVCEMDRSHSLSQHIGFFEKVKRTEYGTIALEIFEIAGGRNKT